MNLRKLIFYFGSICAFLTACALLIFVAAYGLSASAQAAEDPNEQLRIDVCGELVPFYVEAYKLYKAGVPEAITLDIVAYHPVLDEVVGWPVYLGIKALYMAEKVPNEIPYLYATQMGCIETIGLGYRPARVDGRQDDRAYYHTPRKQA